MEQHIKEAIILAGGLGTRLRSAVPDLPKCMAPVNGRPFITWVVDHFKEQGIEHFVFALGYKNEAFLALLDRFSCGNYSIWWETSPGHRRSHTVSLLKNKREPGSSNQWRYVVQVKMKEVPHFTFRKRLYAGAEAYERLYELQCCGNRRRRCHQ